MRPASALVVVLLSLPPAACAGRGPAAGERPADIDARAAWDRLARDLPGVWTATTEGGALLEVRYRLLSRGSALLELFGAAERQTLSVYHPDGRGLMLTHYCAQGNQARLRASAATPDRITFEYEGVTNVGPDQSVMRSLVFVLSPGHLERTEVYRGPDGSTETSVLRFVRAEEGPRQAGASP